MKVLEELVFLFKTNHLVRNFFFYFYDYKYK
jgi:hypothetical protein